MRDRFLVRLAGGGEEKDKDKGSEKDTGSSLKSLLDAILGDLSVMVQKKQAKTEMSTAKPVEPAAKAASLNGSPTKLPAWTQGWTDQLPARLFSPGAGLQAKLTVNQPTDPYEQEADRVAEQVMRMPAPAVQRRCACGGIAGPDEECAACKSKRQAEAEEMVQTKWAASAESGATPAPPGVHRVLNSPGKPLDAAARAFMEPRFGADFGQVRVHTDAQAAESAQAVEARAYTVGRNLVFGAGYYAPGMHAGRQLLAHELAHVVQQRATARVLQRADDDQNKAAPQPQPAGATVPDISKCKNEKQLQGVVKANPTFKAWELETIQKGDNYTKITERVKRRRVDLFEGRLGVYAPEVKKMYGDALLQIGHCLLLPVGWKDPNIGKLPAAPTTFTASDAATQAIALVYAEQTGTGAQAQEQQRYIWFSIRKRIESANFPPDLASVLDPRQYHAIGKSDYTAALDELTKNDPPKLAGVKNAKAIVLANWTNALPSDAGAAYFHWRKDSTSDKCFAGADLATPAGETKEKECAWNWATSIKVRGSVPKKDGWLKRIRGDGGGPIGSMYIYPGD